MKVDAVFIGDKEIESFLKEIPKKFSNQLTINTAKEALKKWTIADAKRRVKSLGIYKTGTIYRSLKVWVWKKGVLAGAQKKMGKKKIKNDAYYAYMVEHGHKDRAGNFIPARPFFRPAWLATKDKVVKEMQDTFWSIVEKYARRKGWM
jgi:hypothetical protein